MTYITAIDIGTSHISGVVGKREENGRFSIVSYATEDCSSCIRRGNVYNLKETAESISKLITKLEARLEGGTINKVYVGVGGQSLRTVCHSESLAIKKDMTITDADIAAIREKCEMYKQNGKDMLGVAQTIYYVDGHKEKLPVGVIAKKLEARSQLVVARETVCNSIRNCFEAVETKEIAGIWASILALADASLSTAEKEIGCALIDFGAGITNIAVYNKGELLLMSTIPLGSNLITQDLIPALKITRTEAERLKIQHGSAILKKEDKLIDVEMDGLTGTVSQRMLSAVIDARVTEITENIYSIISESINFKSLGGGIYITGRGAKLSSFAGMLKSRCKIKVSNAAIRSDFFHEFEAITKDMLYMNAISLMLKGIESCVTFSTPPEELKIIPPEKKAEKVTVKKEKDKKPENNENDVQKKPEVKTNEEANFIEKVKKTFGKVVDIVTNET
jgi:cell division protein FtsA